MRYGRLVAAFLIAPLVPALLFVGSNPALMAKFQEGMWIFLLASLVSYGHAVLLGVPLAWYFLFFRKRPLTLRRVVLISFLVGVLPVSLFLLVRELSMSPGSGYMSNGVWLRVDGRLTIAGVLGAIKTILFCGAFGASVGCAGWFISGLSSNQENGER